VNIVKQWFIASFRKEVPEGRRFAENAVFGVPDFSRVIAGLTRNDRVFYVSLVVNAPPRRFAPPLPGWEFPL